jgi:hypothetical protein
MCHHHRSRCGYGRHGYGYSHHRGGPLQAVVALAVPLLTQRNGERQALSQDTYQPYQDPPTTRLAPQTSGHTVAAAREAPLPTHNEPLDPPPAYDDDDDELEKDMRDMYITERTPSAPAIPANNTYSSVGARDYQPVSSSQVTNTAPQLSTPREIITSAALNPGCRWAVRLQRKEARMQAKLVRKAEKYARKERRDIERGY